MALEINTSKPAHSSNYTTKTSRTISYIVIHYVGGLGDAAANCTYFQGANRDASAHYFVGYTGNIWQSVADVHMAWHCGSKNGYKHSACRNHNSIGIEMCVKKTNSNSLKSEDKDWYFEEATIKAAAALTQELMAKYSIPIENVIRHHDVTGKIFPAPFVHTPAAWENFKTMVAEGGVLGPELIPKLKIDGKITDYVVSSLQELYGLEITGKIKNQPYYYMNILSTELIPACEIVLTETIGGDLLIKEIQKMLGIVADGYIGKTTISTLQRFLNNGGYSLNRMDGFLDDITINGLQKYFNILIDKENARRDQEYKAALEADKNNPE